MLPTWMINVDDSEQLCSSAALLEMLADGRLQHSDRVKNIDATESIEVSEAVRVINRDRRDNESLRLTVLWVAAACSLIAGLIMLINPGSGVQNPLGAGEIANLHMMALGGTLTICGSIFSAAALTFQRSI